MKRKLKVDINKINAMRNIKSTMALSTSMVLATSAIAPTIALANTTDMITTGQEVAFDESDYVAYEYVVEEGEYYELEEESEPIIGPGGATGSTEGSFVIPEGLTEEDYLITDDGEYNEDDYGIDTIWITPIDATKVADETDASDTAYSLGNNGVNWFSSSFYGSNLSKFNEGGLYATRGGGDDGASGYYADKNIIYTIDFGSTPSSNVIEFGDVDNINNLGINATLQFIGFNADLWDSYEGIQDIDGIEYTTTLVSDTSGSTTFSPGGSVYIEFDFDYSNQATKLIGKTYIDTGVTLSTPDLTTAEIKLKNATNDDGDEVAFKGDSTAPVTVNDVEVVFDGASSGSDVTDTSVYTTKIITETGYLGDGAVYVYLTGDIAMEGINWSSNDIAAINAEILALTEPNYTSFDFEVIGYDLSNEAGKTTVKMLNSDGDEITKLTYDGDAVEPDDLEIYYDGTKLTVDNDYTVAYKDNTEIASSTSATPPTITITGTGDYSGEYVHTFDIVEDFGDDSKYSISGFENVAYTGSRATQDNLVVELLDENGNTIKTLTQNTDYRVETFMVPTTRDEMDNPLEATTPGNAMVYVYPIGDYAALDGNGDEFYINPRSTFKITADITDMNIYPAEDATDTSGTYSFEYVASGTNPVIVAKYKTGDLAGQNLNSSFYTVGSVNDNNVGRTFITVKGRTDNGWSGELEVAFDITAQPLENGAISLLKNADDTAVASADFTGQPIVFDGSEKSPGYIEIKDKNDNVLVEGEDYTVTYNNNTNVGTSAAVIVTGIGNYSGTIQKAFSIAAGSSTTLDCEVGEIGEVTWTGNAVEPSDFNIKVNGSTININPEDTTNDGSTGNEGAGNEIADWIIVYNNGTTDVASADLKDVGAYTIKSITGSSINPKYPGAIFTPDENSKGFNLVYDMSNADTYVVGSDVSTTTTLIKGMKKTSLEADATKLATTSTFTGEELEPRVAIVITGEDDGTSTSTPVNHEVTLVADADGTDGFKVTYEGNTNVLDTPKMTIEPADDDAKAIYGEDYTEDVTFAISANEITTVDNIALKETTFKYTGAGIEPTVTSLDFDTVVKTLDTASYGSGIGLSSTYTPVEGTDYNITWGSNSEIGDEATAKFEAGTNGNIKFASVDGESPAIVSYFTATDVFEVAADSALFEGLLDDVPTKVIFNGNDVKFTADSGYLLDDGGDLDALAIPGLTDPTEGTHYTISYENNDKPGWANVIMTGEKEEATGDDEPTYDYTGIDSISKSFQIWTDLSDEDTVFISPGSTTVADGNGETQSSVNATTDDTSLTAGTVIIPEFYYQGGVAIEPEAVVKYRNGTVLGTTPDDDVSTDGYDVSYIANAAVGTGYMSVNASGDNYEGSKAMMPFKIVATPIAVAGTNDGDPPVKNTAINIKIDGEDYGAGDYLASFDGSTVNINDKIALTHGEYTLVYGKDYIINYDNNDAVGAYNDSSLDGSPQAIITGLGGYASENGVEFPLYFSIGTMDVGIDNVSAIADQEYTGLELTPAVDVKVQMSTGEATLTASPDNTADGTGDYYVTYSANTDPGEATAKILGTTSGLLKYNIPSAGIEVKFNIVADLSKAKIEVNGEEYDSTEGLSVSYGTPLTTSALSLYFGADNTEGAVALSSDEISVSWTGVDSNGLGSIGTKAIATIQSGLGKSTYINSAVVNVDITAADITTDTENAKTYIELDSNATSDKMYTGEKIEVENILVKYFKDGDADAGSSTTFLTKDVDYTVDYDNNTNVGEASIIITGMGNYKGTFTDTFSIVENPADALAGFTIEEYVADQTYTGKAIEPALTVKIGEKTLVEDTDYEIVYYSDATEDATVVADGHIKPGLGYVAKVEGKGSYTSVADENITFNIIGNLADTRTLTATITPKYYDGIELQGTAVLEDALTLTGFASAKVYTDYYVLDGFSELGGVAGGYELELVSGSTTTSGTSRWTLQPKLDSNGKSAFTGTRSVSIVTSAVALTDTDNFNYTPQGVDEEGEVIIDDTDDDYAVETNGGRVTLTVTDNTFNGGNIKPTVKLIDTYDTETTDDDYTLDEGTDYTVSYSSASAAGSNVTITITGRGNYSGTTRPVVKILNNGGDALEFSDALSTIRDQSYSGSELKPIPTIYSAGGTKLTEAKYDENGDAILGSGDYSVTYNGLYTAPTYTAADGWTYGDVGDGTDFVSPGYHSVTIKGLSDSDYYDKEDGEASEITLNYLVTAALSNSKLSFAIADTEVPTEAFKDADGNITGLTLTTGNEPELLLTAKYTNKTGLTDIVTIGDGDIAKLKGMLNFTPSTSTDHSSVRSHSITIKPNLDDTSANYTPWFSGSKTISYNIVNTLINSTNNISGLVIGTTEDTSFEPDDVYSKFGAIIYSDEKQSFTGSALKPEITLTNKNSVPLTLNTDYTIAYSNNTNVFDYTSFKTTTKDENGVETEINKYASLEAAVEGGERVPCITITGKGTYSGTIKYYFQIEGLTGSTDGDGDFSLDKDIEGDKVTEVAAQQTYTGNAVTPTSAIYHEGKSLSSSYIKRYYFTEAEYNDGKDDIGALKAAYDANETDKTILPGKHVMYVEGVGNYAGLSQTFTYDIAISLSNSKLRLEYDNSSKDYTGVADSYDLDGNGTTDISKGDRPVSIYFTDSTLSSDNKEVLVYTNDSTKASDVVTSYGLNTGINVDYSGTKDKGTARIVVSRKDSEGELVAGDAYYLDSSSKTLSYTITNRVFDSTNNGDDATTGYKVEVLDIATTAADITSGGLDNATATTDNTVGYTGSALKPLLRITDNAMTEANKTANGGNDETVYVESSDYTITYINNTNVGTANLIITGKNNYAGVLSHTFEIENQATGADNSYFTFGSRNYTTEAVPTGEDGKNLGSGAYDSEFVTGEVFNSDSKIIADQTLAYSSSKTVASTPTLTVKFYNADLNRTVTLYQNTDYKISYKNNGTPGTATATITGMGNYEGLLTQDIEFIVKGNLSTSAVTVGNIKEVYFAKADEKTGYEFEIGAATDTNPNGLTGLVTFLNATGTNDDNGEFTTISETLVNGVDYEVSYTNNTTAATCTVTFTGKGNYTGYTRTTFKISANDIDAEEGKYLSKLTGKMVDPTGISLGAVDSDGKALNPEPSANAALKISADSTPTAATTTTSYKYTGSAIKPTLGELKYVNPDGATITLVENTDYTLSYSNNTALSTDDKKGTITITGKNGFNGTRLYVYFDIVPNNTGVIIDSSVYAISSPSVSSRGAVSVNPTVYGLVGNNWTRLTNNTHYKVVYTKNEEYNDNDEKLVLTSGRLANEEIYVHIFGAGVYESGGSTDDNYSTTSFITK